MKRLVIPAALVAIAMLGAASTSEAQVASALNPVRLGVSLGASIPQGDFGTAVSTGYNVGALVALNPVALPIGFRLEGSFNQFGIKGGGGNANIAAFTGNVLYNIAGGPMLSPYVIGGAGYYHESLSGSLGGGSENHFGWNAGAGLNIPLTGFSTFIEARYNRVSETGGSTTYIPISVGVVF
jgi:hypothetical protein